MDIVNGYDLGADDYITKPFSLMALILKVHALMKRVEAPKVSYLVCGDIRVSLREMKVWKGREPLFLSKRRCSF